MSRERVVLAFDDGDRFTGRLAAVVAAAATLGAALVALDSEPLLWEGDQA